MLSLSQLVASYGSFIVGTVIALESIGLPLPGEAILLIAAVYAGETRDLNIWTVIIAAALGGIIGNIAAYVVGRELGTRLLLRYGSHIGLTEGRIKIGRYLFHRQGITVVVTARFIAVARSVVGLLAGANRMAWRHFLFATVAGSVSWATLYGGAAYMLGHHVHGLMGPAGGALAVVAVIAILIVGRTIARREQELQEAAEKAFPGPLH